MASSDPISVSPAQATPRHWLGSLIFPVLLTITCLCVLVPFSPHLPSAGLDHSWQFGMNQAVAQGLVLGRDIVFTFGPYASIATKSYNPATDGMMIWGSLCFALSFTLTVLLNFRDSHRIIKALLLLTLVCFAGDFDVLVFAHAFFAGLYIISRDVDEHPRQWRTIGCLLVILLPFGLAPLIKGSFILVYAAVAAWAFLHLLIRKNPVSALVLITAPLIYMAIFWFLADQELENILNYFRTMKFIIAGYTDAMSTNGPFFEPVMVIITSFIFGRIIIRKNSSDFYAKWFSVLILASTIFVAWKAGHVRQDAHAITTGVFVIYLGLYFLKARHKAKRYYFVISILSLVNVTVPLYNHSTEAIKYIIPNALNPYVSAWDGLRSRFADNRALARSFASATAQIATAAGLPVLPGTCDIYSHGQSALIASGNQWNPRPVFQSYSAYTPALAELNNAHLSGGAAPDNLFFNVEPIDQRFPALEDGLSWPTILKNYRPAGFAGTYLILKKQSTSPVVLPPPVIQAQHALGEIVAVPQGSGPIFVRIKFRQGILGKLADLLLKSAKLRMWVMLDDGSVEQFRLIAGMTETGFLISPLVRSAADFAHLYTDPGALDGKRVRSLAIVSYGLPGAWRGKYDIAFLPLPSP